MKANRKFLNNDEEAVSPVIAVILMVAITVVLAATVYVWVSGFSGQNSAPAASLSVAQVSALSSTTAGPSTTSGAGLKFTVTAVSAGFQAGNLKVLDATKGLAWNMTITGAATTNFQLLSSGSTPATATTTIVNAGDVIKIYYASNAIATGDTIQFVDTNSNNVIASTVLR